MLQYNASCERLTNVCKWGSSEITVFPLCYLSLAVCINYTALSGFVNLMDLFTFCWLHRQRGVDLSTVRLLILSISLIMNLRKLITSNAYFLLALLVFFQSIFNSVLLQSPGTKNFKSTHGWFTLLSNSTKNKDRNNETSK